MGYVKRMLDRVAGRAADLARRAGASERARAVVVWARSARGRAVLPWVPLALAVGLLARVTLGAVLARLGHPGGTLDDTYIHLQYARAIAEGHPLRFHAGEAVSSGSTSLLWPLVLAPFWAVGLRGELLLWPAWILSFVALFGLAREAFLLTDRLAGRYAAIGAAAMTAAFGGFLWGAASGMEIVPFAWLVATTARRAAEWSELAPEARSPRLRRALLALAFAAPLMRPEGSLSAALVAVALAAFATSQGHRSRAWTLAALAGALAPQLVFFVATGRAFSDTTQVKLLVGNPYFPLWDTAHANARLLVSTLLDGQVWSAEFLPKGGAPVLLAGLAAVTLRGHASGRLFRAAAVLVVAMSIFVPCFYVTFLWNRLRYLWPFFTGWIVGLACLARVVGDVGALVDRRFRMITPVVAGLFAGALVTKLDWVIDDVAGSASGIDRQQVALGRWAATALPPDARIGVNDTGAIAYFGGHKTFDVVGLTTASEGRYWVAGAGSRLEHYERLRRDAPQRLPTHFIVYPEWMGCEAVLGAPLHEARVTDATILGGQTMRAYEARYDTLGTGELPWTKTGRVLDTVDVADLESEREHGYQLLGARDGEQAATEALSPEGARVVDGGRTKRTRERFFVSLAEGRAARGVMRVEATAAGAGDVTVAVRANGREVATFRAEPGPWAELTFVVPADATRARTDIELVVNGGWLTVYHYWFDDAPG